MSTDPVILLCGMQAAFFRSDPLRQRRVGLVNAVNRLLREMAACGPDVVWLAADNGGPLLPGLLPPERGDRTIVVHPKMSGYFGTILGEIDRRGIPCYNPARPVVLAGIQTHETVRATAVDAWQRGHPVHLAVDAAGSNDPEHESITLRWLASAGIAKVQTIAGIARELGGVVA